MNASTALLDAGLCCISERALQFQITGKVSTGVSNPPQQLHTQPPQTKATQLLHVATVCWASAPLQTAIWRVAFVACNIMHCWFHLNIRVIGPVLTSYPG